MSSLEKARAESVLTQGSVLDEVPWGLDPNPLGIVLTNPCDLTWEKASFLLLAALKPAREIIQSSREFKERVQSAQDNELSGNKWERLERHLSEFALNAGIRRWFLVEADVLELEPLFVDFQHLIAVPFEKLSSPRIVAVLPSPDREKMIVHFAGYTSRIGVDDPDEENMRRIVAALASPFRPRAERPT
jgi:hypothetical protein